MKEVTTNSKSSIKRLVSLVVAQIFFCSSVFPAWATPSPTISHLRPSASDGANREDLVRELRETEATSDGGRKKIPRSYRRRTDEEVRIAHLFTLFDTLHGEIDRVTTLLVRLKGKMTEEEERATQIEFARLLERLKELSKELPETLPADVPTLQTKNKELKEEIRLLRQEIRKAYEAKDDATLTQLNAAMTQKLWLRSWIELELAYAFLTEKKNPSAALALLIGVRNRMSDLNTEYWWRRVRAYIDQEMTQETLEDWFGIPVEVTYVGPYDIKLSKKGDVTIYRRHWKRRVIETAGGEKPVMTPELTAFKFQDMPTALRSEIHIVLSQSEAYRDLLHALSNIQHLILRMEQQKKKREAMPKKELQTALEITHAWAHRGIATDLRRQAIPDLESARVYLGKELYEEVATSLERAKQKLRVALERQKRTRQRTQARALVFLNEWRGFLENRERLVAGLKTALEEADPKNPQTLLTHLRTLRGETFRAKPKLLALQSVYNRLNQTLVFLGKGSALLAKEKRTPNEERRVYSLAGAAKKNLRLMLEDLEPTQKRENAPDGAVRTTSIPQPFLHKLQLIPAINSP